MTIEGKRVLVTESSSGIGVVRGGEMRAAMIARTRGDPAAPDQRFRGMKPEFAAAVRNDSSVKVSEFSRQEPRE